MSNILLTIPVGSISLTGHETTLISEEISLFDPNSTVLSQYANSPIILQLINYFYQAVDVTADFNNFYNLIWNVNTAVGYGLDVWGRIVGVGRYLQIPISSYFGMQSADGSSGEPFNQAPFYIGEALTQNYALTDDAYRQLIYAKALANITQGSTQAIKYILQTMFPDSGGNAYVVDGNDMTMTYTFDFVPTPVQEAIIGQSGVLPQPTGVQVYYNYL